MHLFVCFCLSVFAIIPTSLSDFFIWAGPDQKLKLLNFRIDPDYTLGKPQFLRSNFKWIFKKFSFIG